jgi:hypothetical protein
VHSACLPSRAKKGLTSVREPSSGIPDGSMSGAPDKDHSGGVSHFDFFGSEKTVHRSVELLVRGSSPDTRF